MRRILAPATIAVVLATTLLGAGATSASGKNPVETMTLKGMGAFLGADAPADLTLPVGHPDPLSRAKAWAPRPPGTKDWITLEYGPYVVHPGSDLSRLDVEVWGADGYAVGFYPSVHYADGAEASSHDIHIHHAHWTWLDPDAPGTHRWFYGTGEERTQGSIMPAAKADPRFKKGLRYGVEVRKGDRMGFISMLHNKTAATHVVWLKVRIEFVYGTHPEIKKAKGWNFHKLTPALYGSTFNAWRTGGIYDYPLDATKKSIGPHGNYSNPIATAEVVPGVGQVWESPWEGDIIIGAGHSHPGAYEVVLSNLGTKKDPCPQDGDRFPGVTAARSRNITRNNVFPSEEFQMGLTQPGWRVHVRKGDRLVINGVYDTKRYEYPDAMSYFGLYLDEAEKTSKKEACTVELIDRPNASKAEIVRTLPNQEWPEHHAMPTCTRCNKPGPLPKPGPRTNVVHIAGHQYLPGNLGLEGEPFGPPVVTRGEMLEFINEDYAAGGVRHSITSCRAPCNGEYVVNYPFHDGVFDSGALGYTWEDAYVTAKDEPHWSFDTSSLKAGYYAYYCRLHPWMRGSFYVRPQ